jgi:hypothetical protein
MPALYSGDALYAGRDMGTDQSRPGLASGQETAQTILAGTG